MAGDLRSQKAFNTTLATALVHHYPPKHHPRALGIITDILNTDRNNIRCLMGRAYILQHAKKCAEAGSVFSRVVELIPDDPNDGLRAKEELAWCHANNGELQKAVSLLKDVISQLDELEGRDEDKARCWWRLGKCLWDMGGMSMRHILKRYDSH